MRAIGSSATNPPTPATLWKSSDGCTLQLGELWNVERQRLEMEEPPLTPLVLRERERLKAEAERSEFPVSRSIS